MKSTMKNSCHIEGYVYEHKLDRKISGPQSKNPGTPYIVGELSIATDDSLLNIVKVFFRYVTETTRNGKANTTHLILSNIIDGKTGSVMEHGVENAGKVRIDTAIGLNEWYDFNSPGTPLVSVMRNDGGFIHTISEFSEPSKRATFDVDMVITNTIRHEADDEKNIPEHASIKGCVFSYDKKLLPVEFKVYNPKGIEYFESLEPSNKTPVFTNVVGEQVSKVIVTVEEEEAAFGDEPILHDKSRTQREFVVTKAIKTPYLWDDESTILASELAKAISDREIDLATKKKNSEDYRENRTNNFNATPTTKIAASSNTEYDF